jgi:Tol biopolymer transport system component
MVPLRSFAELRSEVGRRAVRLRRRQTAGVVVSAVATVLAVALGYAAIDRSKPVDLNMVDRPGTTATTVVTHDASTKGGSPARARSATSTSVAAAGGDPKTRPADVLVFASDRSGASQLYAMPLAGGTARQITHASGSATRPAVSPDGRLIAYEYDADGTSEVRVVRADGVPVRTLRGDDARAPAWSPNGEKVAFAAQRAIWVVDADGGSPVRLTGEDPKAVDGEPTWSSDGERIAFFRFHTDGRGEVMVMRANGAEPRTVVANVATAPAWSPDGSRIAYVDLSSSPGRLAVVDVDGRNRRVLTGSDAWAGRPTWTTDSRQLLFDRDVDGHTPPSCLVGVYGGEVVNRCLPTSNGPAHAELWTIGADGAGPHVVSSSRGNDVSPSVGRSES